MTSMTLDEMIRELDYLRGKNERLRKVNAELVAELEMVLKLSLRPEYRRRLAAALANARKEAEGKR